MAPARSPSHSGKTSYEGRRQGELPHVSAEDEGRAAGEFYEILKRRFENLKKDLLNNGLISLRTYVKSGSRTVLSRTAG